MTSREMKHNFTHSHVQTVVINYDGAGPKNINLQCPFIADTVEIQAFTAWSSTSGSLLGPLYANPAVMGNEQGYTGCDIFLIQLPFLPSGSFVIANATNTVNPICRFDNSYQNNFQGSYQVNAYNSTGVNAANQITNFATGQIILNFTFTKYQ